MPTADPEHYREVAKLLRLGKVIPFLGAGVNLCDRPPTITAKTWKKSGYLPRGGELAEYLAEEFNIPESQNRSDLMRVSQYVSVIKGQNQLYDSLQALLKGEFPTTQVHRFFARLCKLLQTTTPVASQPVLFTTNYDRVMESALHKEGVAFDVVYYDVGKKGSPGIFKHLRHAELHQSPSSGTEPDWVEIRDPKKYFDLPIGQRPVVVKIHGAVDCQNVEKCSFVISEDDYIDYMTGLDFAMPLPKQLMGHLRQRQFLFLGYGLRDWNLRVILQRLWRDQRQSVRCWAIDRVISDLDERSWRKWDVDLLA